jgi:molecular chaperone DnaK (HSP70)
LFVNNITNVSGYPAEKLCTSATLHAKAEEAKKELTYHESVEVSCLIPKTSNNTIFGNSITIFVTNEEFHRSCSSLFDRAMIPVIRLLNELGKPFLFNYIPEVEPGFLIRNEQE